MDAYFKRDFLIVRRIFGCFFFFLNDESRRERERERKREIALLFSSYLMNNKQIIIHEMFESS